MTDIIGNGIMTRSTYTGPKAAYSPFQPLVHIPDDEFLPVDMHELAAQWRALNDATEDTEQLWNEKHAEALRAPGLDRARMALAAEKGQDFPEVTTPVLLAEADLLADQLSARREALTALGRQLRTQMADRRQELALLARSAIDRAFTDAEAAVTQASAILRGPATSVSEAGWLMSFIGELKEPRGRIEGQTGVWTGQPSDAEQDLMRFKKQREVFTTAS